MPLPDDVIERARKLDRQAAEAVLTESYAPMWRIAHAVIGKPEAARKVVERVFRTSLRVMPTWRQGLSPSNWFYHHTLLNSRPAAEPPPPIKQDLLVLAGNESPEYLAFIAALRRLPIQQREAFILHHGEKLQERQLGVAMDSSTTAAANHLRAATETLNTVTSGKVPDFALQLAAAYAKIEPTEKTVVPYIRQQVGRAIWWRRIRRAIRRLLILAILAGLAFLGWRYRAQILEEYHLLRSDIAGAEPTIPSTQPTTRHSRPTTSHR